MEEEKESGRNSVDSTYAIEVNVYSCPNVLLKMDILLNVLLILGLVPHVLLLVIRCEEVDSIDVLAEANSEILYFWDCATRGGAAGRSSGTTGETLVLYHDRVTRLV